MEPKEVDKLIAEIQAEFEEENKDVWETDDLDF